MFTACIYYDHWSFNAALSLPPEQVTYRLHYDLITVQTDDATATAEIEEEVLGITAARQRAVEIASTKCLDSRIHIERTHPTIREVETVEQGEAAKKRNCK